MARNCKSRIWTNHSYGKGVIGETMSMDAGNYGVLFSGTDQEREAAFMELMQSMVKTDKSAKKNMLTKRTGACNS